MIVRNMSFILILLFPFTDSFTIKYDSMGNAGSTGWSFRKYSTSCEYYMYESPQSNWRCTNSVCTYLSNAYVSRKFSNIHASWTALKVQFDANSGIYARYKYNNQASWGSFGAASGTGITKSFASPAGATSVTIEFTGKCSSAWLDNVYFLATSPAPTDSPTPGPTPSPSLAPSQSPTYSPTIYPTHSPTFFTFHPTTSPSDAPSSSPSQAPTTPPTNFPTMPPTLAPILNPTRVPSIAPSNYPTTSPSNSPSSSPSDVPSNSPTIVTITPSNAPSLFPTLYPTYSPSLAPSMQPSTPPTNYPSFSPSDSPSNAPSLFPTLYPTYSPSLAPSLSPSNIPSIAPSVAPTLNPTNVPTFNPTFAPSLNPTTFPSLTPSFSPTYSPSIAPSFSPTQPPSTAPSMTPTYLPSNAPTNAPTLSPSIVPSKSPTTPPSNAPSQVPTKPPSNAPTKSPTMSPSDSPTKIPTTPPSTAPSTTPTSPPSAAPTLSPTSPPTNAPTKTPTQPPTNVPSNSPSTVPSLAPSDNPSTFPSNSPTFSPSISPSTTPSLSPSISPSQSPTIVPTQYPTFSPTTTPTLAPSISPTNTPSAVPTVSPTNMPSDSPSATPTYLPSNVPTNAPTALPTPHPTYYTLHHENITSNYVMNNNLFEITNFKFPAAIGQCMNEFFLSGRYIKYECLEDGSAIHKIYSDKNCKHVISTHYYDESTDDFQCNGTDTYIELELFPNFQCAQSQKTKIFVADGVCSSYGDNKYYKLYGNHYESPKDANIYSYAWFQYFNDKCSIYGFEEEYVIEEEYDCVPTDNQNIFSDTSQRIFMEIIDCFPISDEFAIQNENVLDIKGLQLTEYDVSGYAVAGFMVLSPFILILIALLFHKFKSGSDTPKYISLFKFFGSTGDFYTDAIWAFTLYSKKNPLYYWSFLFAFGPHLISVIVGLFYITNWRQTRSKRHISEYAMKFDTTIIFLTLLSGFYATTEIITSHLFHLNILSLQITTKQKSRILNLQILNEVILEDIPCFYIQYLYLSTSSEPIFDKGINITLLAMIFGSLSMISGVLTLSIRIFNGCIDLARGNNLQTICIQLSFTSLQDCINNNHTHSHSLLSDAIAGALHVQTSQINIIYIQKVSKGIKVTAAIKHLDYNNTKNILKELQNVESEPFLNIHKECTDRLQLPSDNSVELRILKIYVKNKNGTIDNTIEGKSKQIKQSVELTDIANNNHQIEPSCSLDAEGIMDIYDE